MLVYSQRGPHGAHRIGRFRESAPRSDTDLGNSYLSSCAYLHALTLQSLTVYSDLLNCALRSARCLYKFLYCSNSQRVKDTQRCDVVSASAYIVTRFRYLR